MGDTTAVIGSGFGAVVLVQAAPDARAAVARSGLTLCELLRPWSNPVLLPDPYTRAAFTGRRYPINQFPLRFVDCADLAPKSPTSLNNIATAVVRATLPVSLDKHQTFHGREDVHQYIEDGQHKSHTPWYNDFRDTFLQSFSPSDHDTTDHPVAALCVVTTSNSDPMNTLAQLYDAKQPPEPFRNGVIDPYILKLYLLIHDYTSFPLAERQAAADRAVSMFEQMRITFGIDNCQFITLNSRDPNTDTRGPLPDIWSHYLVGIREDADRRRKLAKENPVSHDFDGSSTKHMLAVSTSVTATSSSPAMSSPILSRSGSVDSMLSSAQSTSADQSFSSPNPPPINYLEGERADLPSPSSSPPPEETEVTALSQLNEDDDVFKSSGPDAPAFIDPLNALGLDIMVNDATTDGGLVPPPTAETAVENAEDPDEAIFATMNAARPGWLLSDKDVKQIQVMLRELVIRQLLPYLEKTMMNLNDRVSAHRRGIRGSLFSGAKKWFGSSGPTHSPQQSNQLVVVYAYSSPESQMRKLADLSFILQDYEAANAHYHAVRKECHKSWMFVAGAHEMIGYCMFLMGSPRMDLDQCFDSAINNYLQRCKAPMYAARVSILAAEVYKAKGQFREASTLYIRAARESESELRSALMLEQAGHCFLATSTPQWRKHAFHLVLAGHRYIKCGQREHAIRCYHEALSIIQDRSWHSAEDHVRYTLGRQTFHLNDGVQAAAYLSTLLATTRSVTPQQESGQLKEYIFICKQFNLENPLLPIPLVDNDNIAVILPVRGSSGDVSALDLIFNALEQSFQPITRGSRPVAPVVVPRARLDGSTDNKEASACALGEAITVEVSLRNPLQISLQLTNVVLNCLFEPSSNRSTSSSSTEAPFYDAFVLPEVTLEPNETKKVRKAED